MLRDRLLTAAVLIPFIVWTVLVLPTRLFAAVYAFVVVLGAWEWAGLMGIFSRYGRVGYVVLLTTILVACVWLISFPAGMYLVLVVSAVWWIVALFLIRQFGAESGADATNSMQPGLRHFHPKWLLGILGILVLVPPWLSLIVIHGSALSGGPLVLMFLVLIWGADSGAYFAGRQWGKSRLAPLVSPGKTWEGVYGALAIAALVSIASGFWLELEWQMQVTLVLLSFVTVLFSIVGDLFESMVKRLAGVKDSGQLIPGHGGVLDRIDSITAAAPVFALGLLTQGMIL